MKAVKAWAVVQDDILCREALGSQWDVYKDRSKAADVVARTTFCPGTKPRIVRVLITEVRPKKERP